MSITKILRLHDDTELIATVDEAETGFYLYEPMEFAMDGNGGSANLMMQFYLPVRLIKKNEIFLAHEEIKFILDPTDDFSEFYINTVEKVKALFELRDSMDDLEETIEDIVIRNFKDLDTSNMTKQ
jgi:hypothetical protein